MKRFDFDLVGIIEIAAGMEPTPKELKVMIDLAKEHDVKVIFTHSQHSDRAARIIAESTNVKIYKLDPLGGVSDRKTYEEILLYNTQVILEALK